MGKNYMKRLIPVLLGLVLFLLPITVLAESGSPGENGIKTAVSPAGGGTAAYEYIPASTTYTVILDPGEGTGDPVTYRSSDGSIAANWREAGDCQFYYEEDRSIGLHLNDGFYPDSFSPPEGFKFDGWKGNITYNKLAAADTTFTAKWRRSGAAQFTMTSEATVGDFDANGRAPVTVEVTSLDFGPDYFENPLFYLLINSCDFQGEGGTISSLFSGEDYGNPSSYVFQSFEQPGSFTFLVCVDPEALASAAPGIYTGETKTWFTWEGVAEGVEKPSEGRLKLTLAVPVHIYQEPQKMEQDVIIHNIQADGSRGVPKNVKIKTMKITIRIQDGDKVVSAAEDVEIDLTGDTKYKDLPVLFDHTITDLAPGKYSISVEVLSAEIEGDPEFEEKYNIKAEAWINKKGGVEICLIWNDVNSVAEPVVYALPEDEVGAYALNPDGTKEYLLFHTYDICMFYLGRDDLCSGYEHCFHKEFPYTYDNTKVGYFHSSNGE